MKLARECQLYRHYNGDTLVYVLRMTRPNAQAIRIALEAAGVEFIAENGGGPGARLHQPLSPERRPPPMTNCIRRVDPAAVSTRLVCLREWIGLSPKQMAAACAVTPRAYRAWERGRRKWHRGGFLDTVCRATGVSAGWMLTGRHLNEPLSPIPLAGDALPLPKRLRTPGAHDRLELLMNALVDGAPAHVLRQAALDYLSASGMSERQASWRVNELMRNLNDLHTRKLTTEAC